MPVSDTEALITTGASLNALDRIERVGYAVDAGDRVHVGPGGLVLAEGESLRLGGWFGDALVYSSAKGVRGASAPTRTAHQPFVHQGTLYYTDGWPHVSIYRDGELFLGHFGDMVQVGNPCWAGDVMYFEARATDDPRAAGAWQIWKRDADGALSFVCQGANPATHEGRLFYGTWNGRCFDYRCRAI